MRKKKVPSKMDQEKLNKIIEKIKSRSAACGACKGSGKRNNNPCGTCDGTGRITLRPL